MLDSHEAIDLAIEEVSKARSAILRIKAAQIRSSEDINYLKAVVYSWTRTHRETVIRQHPTKEMSDVDSNYCSLLTATGKHTAKTVYASLLLQTKNCLVKLRSDVLVSQKSLAPSIDSPPDFSALAADKQMQDILTRRWQECVRCINAQAHLAATVMMGGLLEALFVGKANKMADKSSLFKAKSTPLDPKTKKPVQLSEWTLRPYIDVGYEIGWITKSGKDIAAVLRDYRNYVHPEKERSHNVTLGEFDSSMFWEITKLLARQLLTIS